MGIVHSQIAYKLRTPNCVCLCLFETKKKKHENNSNRYIVLYLVIIAINPRYSTKNEATESILVALRFFTIPMLNRCLFLVGYLGGVPFSAFGTRDVGAAKICNGSLVVFDA
jgi:hypothetical protein